MVSPKSGCFCPQKGGYDLRSVAAECGVQDTKLALAHNKGVLFSPHGGVSPPNPLTRVHG
jgi:hypothetical protein